MGNLTRKLVPVGTSAGTTLPLAAVTDHVENARAKVPLAPYVMLALALIGIADTFYVAHASYTGQSLWCAILEGCNTVIKSPYARLLGIPVSYFGLTFYVYMLGFAALLAFDPVSRGLRLGALLYPTIGVSYSLYFAYLQLSAIRAVCIYCLISAVTTLLLLVTGLQHFNATRIRPANGRPVRVQ